MDDYAESFHEPVPKPQKQKNPNTEGDQIIVNIKAMSSPKQSTMPAAAQA